MELTIHVDTNYDDKIMKQGSCYGIHGTLQYTL